MKLDSEQRQRKIESIQRERLIAAAKTFLQKHQNTVIPTPSFQQEAKNLLFTIEHTLKTSNDKELESSLENVKSRMAQLVANMDASKSIQLHDHHLTNIKEVTIEKVERLKQVNRGESKNIRINDTVSAERIQTLLQDQKDMYTKELEDEQRNQVVIMKELSELTFVLKETTIDIHSAVNIQNTQLTDMQKFAEENQQELENQKKKMNLCSKSMTNSVWTGFGMMIWIIALFVATYVVIRIIPKPTSERTC